MAADKETEAVVDVAVIAEGIGHRQSGGRGSTPRFVPVVVMTLELLHMPPPFTPTAQNGRRNVRLRRRLAGRKIGRDGQPAMVAVATEAIRILRSIGFTPHLERAVAQLVDDRITSREAKRSGSSSLRARDCLAVAVEPKQ
ncbi:MAG TPA: hypothetical protein VHR44_16295 [Beijerinckiaceae bacterium]|nr:hypothetical protein [Beijerinckiaceae bacterium]